MIPLLPGPWLLLAALALVAVAVRRERRPAPREVALLGALFLGAAVARLAGGLWGPLHINGQGPLWIRGALEATALTGYGPGYYELFNWVARLGRRPDYALFAANAVLSALGPALLYAAARLLGVARGGALAAALVLAVDAVTIRTAASEGYFSSLIALVLSVQVALALALRAERRGDVRSAGAALIAAGLVAAAAARIHPMAYLPLALCPLAVFGATPAAGWGARVTRTLAAAAVIGAGVLLTSGAVIVNALRASAAVGHACGGLAPREGAGLAIALVLAWWLRRRVTPPWLPVLAIASLAVMWATRTGFLQHPLWQLCYQRLFLPGVLLGAAPLLVRRLQAPVWIGLVAVVGGVALFLPAAPHLRGRTTEQLEYRFLRDVLGTMPPGCALAGVGRAGQRVWEIPGHLIPHRGPAGGGARWELTQAADLTAAAASNECLLYVHSSLCTSPAGRARCAAIERAAPLEQVASRLLPAVPSYVGLPYDRPAVEVTVFRVTGTRRAPTGRAPRLPDGAALTPALTRALYEQLGALRETDGCRVIRVDTVRFRATVVIATAAGEQHPLELALGAAGAGQRAGRWVIAPARALERTCGSTLAAIERALRRL